MRRLQRRLRALYARPAARMGTLGVYVKVLKGRVLFARRGRRLLHPASCVKLVTASAALRVLGRDFRFATEVRGRLEGRRLTSPLVLRGEGDPSLVRSDLERFAQALHAKGVRRVPELLVDDTAFDGRRWPPGFGRPSSSAYMTPTGGVSLDGNTVEVVISPTQPGQKAKVTLLPPSDYLELGRRVKTGEKTRLFVTSVRRGAHLHVVVSGSIATQSAPVRRWTRVMAPGLYAGLSFKRMLETQGMEVGKVRLVRRLGRAGSRAARLPLILRHRSKPLWELVQHMDRKSDNFYAEQILKRLGAQVFGRPGSTRKGVRAAARLLARAGIRARRYRMSNGSGLFGNNAFSPRQLVRLLERVSTLKWLFRTLWDSLPVAGLLGTLSKRMGGTVAASHVHAKTGTLNGVSCLAGFVEGRSGRRPLVFAILHNGFVGPQARVRRIQDKMVEAMARYQQMR